MLHLNHKLYRSLKHRVTPKIKEGIKIYYYIKIKEPLWVDNNEIFWGTKKESLIEERKKITTTDINKC